MSLPRDASFVPWTAVLTVLAALTSPGVARAMPTGADGATVIEAQEALREVRVEHAAELIEPVYGRHPSDADVLFTVALVRFHRGDYTGAVAALQDAPASDASVMRGIIEATADATESFVEARSSDGRFVVSHAPGPDAILVPYAFEALAAADRVLAEDLGYRMPGPIRLEIYPTAATLAAVSTLSVEEIERTGTIALCKWDRLMVTSPRALLRGYPWMDTIGHEFVHLVLTRASRDHAPVWFQEGVAKFLERRWRGEGATAQLEPVSLALLTRAVAEDSLLPFERLHPSIARLPSQEQAALAFAQVATFFETFYGAYGGDALRAAVRRIAGGEDAREALVAEAEAPWSQLEGRWRDSLTDLERPEDPPEMLPLRFRSQGDVDVASQLPLDEAKRFYRLGQLLESRGRPGAAAVEYGRAFELVPDDPRVATRLARTSLDAGDPAPAVQALGRIVERHPEHAPTQAILGAAHVAQGNLVSARDHLEEALRLNPFDPSPHCDLALAAESSARRERERELCVELGGRPR